MNNAGVASFEHTLEYTTRDRQGQHDRAWSSPRVELDLPAVAKPYSLLFTTLSFTTEGTENTEFFSVLSVVSVVIMP